MDLKNYAQNIIDNFSPSAVVEHYESECGERFQTETCADIMTIVLLAYDYSPRKSEFVALLAETLRAYEESKGLWHV